MKYLIILVILGVAWSIPNVRATTYGRAAVRLQPVTERTLSPIHRYQAQTRAELMIQMLAREHRNRRQIPDPRTFQQWVNQRVDAKARLDPWGNPFYLEVTRTSLTVGSLGRDRERGTSDDIRVSYTF